MDQLQMQLPVGLTILDTQVAGHTFNPNTSALGLLKDETSCCVLKPMGKPECGARELSFYESLQKTTDPVLMAARKFVPKYYKTLNIKINSKDHIFLQLEDLTHGMQTPNIMDIKVGSRTWDPLATPQKRSVEEKKYVQCKQVLGICLPGFQVFSEHGGYQKYGREYGKQLDSSGLKEAIKIFLNAQTSVCQPLVREVLRQLNDIRTWFREQKLLHFYASSLLIVYDHSVLQTLTNAQSNNSMSRMQQLLNGNADTTTHICSVNEMDPLPPTPPKDKAHSDIKYTYLEDYVKVKMIDFAHVFPSKSGTIDTNYLFGLENLINILEDILKR